MVGELSIQEIQKYSGKGFTRNFMAATDDCELYMDLVTTDKGTRLFLHLEYLGTKFTKTSYKRMLEDFEEVIDVLVNSAGVQALYAVTNVADSITNFTAMFGFSPIQALTDKDNHCYAWVMERKIG